MGQNRVWIRYLSRPIAQTTTTTAMDSDGNASGMENSSVDSDGMTDDADTYDLSYIEVTPAGTYYISIPEGKGCL